MKPTRRTATEAVNRKRLGKTARLARHAKSTETVAAVEGDRVAKLDAKAFHWLARGREANIELGRVFNELKTILRHGKWQRHFSETFAPCGIALRTAENYMKAAHEADSKIEKVSIFKLATDRNAQTIRGATERAQAEVGPASGHDLRKENIRFERTALYHLPLHLRRDEMTACDALQKLPEWPRAEQKIVALLKQLWIEYNPPHGSSGEHLVK